MIRLIVATLTLLLTGIASAESVYVTDEMKVTLRTGTSTRHEIVRMIPTGTELTVLERDRQAGYTKVRTPGGTQGWILSRYLMEQPPARMQLAAAREQAQQLQQQVEQLRQQMTEIREQQQAIEKDRQQLREENAQLSQDLAELRRVSSDAVNIAEENRKLNQRLAEIESSSQMLRQENASLRDRSNRDWFIVGAIVVIASMLMGILLTRIRWRKRSSWSDL